jgi:tetratricopeptide (TPR) repeat protein
MKPYPFRNAALLLTVATVLLSGRDSFAAGPSPDTLIAVDNWYELQIPPYSIISNCRKDRVRDFGRGLEQFFAVIDRAWPGLEDLPRSRETRRIYIFEKEAQFQSILAVSNRYANRKTVRGLFLRDDESIVLLVDASGSPYPLRILQHELVHDLLGDRTSKVPLWFNEGLAEYYGSFLTHDDVVEIGRPIPHHMERLQMAPWIDIRDLFSIDRDSPDYNEGSKAGTFYAESWALVHYLLQGRPDQPADWRRYVEQIDEGDDPLKAFEDAFGLDERGLDEELAAYVARDSWPSQRVPLGELKLATAREPRPLDAARSLCLIGDLVRRMDTTDGNLAEARPWYEEALRRSPQSLEAREALARLDSFTPPTGTDAVSEDAPSAEAAAPAPSKFLTSDAVNDTIETINRLIERQRLEEALSTLERLIPRCPDPTILDELFSWRDSLRATVGRNAAAKAYNAAVKAYNAGKYREAARILDGIAGKHSDPELEASIRELRRALSSVKR